MDKFTTIINSTPYEFNYFIYSHSIEEYFVMVYGEVEGKVNVPLRIQGSCFLAESFGGVQCDCRSQLDYAMRYIINAEFGILIYVRLPTIKSCLGCYREDIPEFIYDGIGEVLHRLKVESVLLYTEDQRKAEACGKYLSEIRPLLGVTTQYNSKFLREKIERKEEEKIERKVVSSGRSK